MRPFVLHVAERDRPQLLPEDLEPEANASPTVAPRATSSPRDSIAQLRQPVPQEARPPPPTPATPAPAPVDRVAAPTPATPASAPVDRVATPPPSPPVRAAPSATPAPPTHRALLSTAGKETALPGVNTDVRIPPPLVLPSAPQPDPPPLTSALKNGTNTRPPEQRLTRSKTMASAAPQQSAPLASSGTSSASSYTAPPPLPAALPPTAPQPPPPPPPVVPSAAPPTAQPQPAAAPRQLRHSLKSATNPKDEPLPAFVVEFIAQLEPIRTNIRAALKKEKDKKAVDQLRSALRNHLKLVLTNKHVLADLNKDVKNAPDLPALDALLKRWAEQPEEPLARLIKVCRDKDDKPSGAIAAIGPHQSTSTLTLPPHPTSQPTPTRGDHALSNPPVCGVEGRHSG